MDNCKIREACDQDLDAVYQCSLAMYHELKSYNMPFEVNPSRLKDIIKANIAGKTSVVYVLEYEGRISGIVIGNMSKFDGRYKPEYGNIIGRITEIYIAPDLRGRNLAQELMNKAIEWFRLSGVNYVEADILTGNAASGKLFEQMGFSTLSRSVYRII